MGLNVQTPAPRSLARIRYYRFDPRGIYPSTPSVLETVPNGNKEASARELV